jgi:hypothetical protein
MRSVAHEVLICSPSDGLQKKEVNHPSSSVNPEGKPQALIYAHYMEKPALNHCDPLKSQSKHTGRASGSAVTSTPVLTHARSGLDHRQSYELISAPCFRVDGGRVSGRRWPGESLDLR